MITILTGIALAILTAGFVAWHLKRTDGGRGEACPRCGSEVPASALRCPVCQVPMQVFEIAGAEVAGAEEPAGADGPEGTDRLHAIVRADVCVGCAACVPACPVDGAIRMEGKLAVVDVNRCSAEAKCVEACPVGGIVLGTGADVHRVTVPDVRADFQTNVPGVYIAGELGGRGLIKNAINEGRVAVENVARDLREEPGPAPDARAFDLVIVGSGPAGLSAALTARAEGLHYVVLEQGSLADSIRRYPRHKLLLAEPVGIPLYGNLWVADASKETLLSVWDSMIAEHELEIRSGRRVEAVVPRDGLLAVRGQDFEVLSRRVILANGRRGTPRRLGVPGEDTASVFYDVVEMEQFRGRRVLIVGGGDSALESAVGVATQPGAEVTLSYRKSTFDRAKERNVAKLEEAERAGRLRVLRESTVQEIGAGSVRLALADGRTADLPIDDVIVRIGGEPPTKFLDAIGVRSVTKEIPLAQAEAGVGA